MYHSTCWRFVVVLALVILVVTTGVGCMMVGKVAGKLMTKKTSDLSTAAVQARFARNLYTPDTKTTEAQYVGEQWVEAATWPSSTSRSARASASTRSTAT